MLQAAGLAAAASDLGELAAAMLPPLATALDTSVAGLFVAREQGLECRPLRSCESAFAEYQRHLRADDPLHQAKLRHNPRLAIMNEVVSSSVLRGSVLYQEVYRRHDAEHHLVARLGERAFGRPGAVGLVLARSRRRPFERRELDELGRLLPIFDAVVERNRRWQALGDERRTLAELVAHTCRGAALAFEPNGRLLWRSDEAAVLLPAQVPPLLREAVRRLGALTEAEAPPGALALTVALAPALSAALYLSHAPEQGRPLVLVRLERADVDSRDAGRAVAAFGLTRAEHAVLEVLARGASNREIARQLHIAEETVRSHLKRVFDKLGVRSRLEAVVKLRDHGTR
jgi:DNA-binding CsgD family transcriptional regulator